MAKKNSKFSYPDTSDILPALEDKRKEIIASYLEYGNEGIDYKNFLAEMSQVNADICVFVRVKKLGGEDDF